MAKIVVTGIPEIDKKLKALGPKVANKIARQAVRDALRPMQAAVKANAPEDTGLMEKMVKLRAGKKSRQGFGYFVYLSSKDFPDRYYSAYQEYGTSTQPGRGFFRSAFDAGNEAAKKQAEDNIIKGIDKEAD